MNTLTLSEIPRSTGQLWTAKYSTPFGLSRTVIMRLDSTNKYLVYSPGLTVLDQAKELLGKNAELILVAPSLGHTLGIAAWLQAFPNAQLIAAKVTQTKLHQQGLKLKNVTRCDEARLVLPKHIELVEIPHCQSGEIWITLCAQEQTFWLTCDGVMNIPELSKNIFKGLLQRLYGLKLGLWMTPAFISNVTDKKAFKDWFSHWLEPHAQVCLIPCHGDIYDAPDAKQRLLNLVASRC